MNGKVIGLGLVTMMAIGLLAFGLSRPVDAAECTSYDHELVRFRAVGKTPIEIPAGQLAKTVLDLTAITDQPYAGVTRGFVDVEGDVTVFGLEIAGCLLDPIVITRPDSGA